MNLMKNYFKFALKVILWKIRQLIELIIYSFDHMR